MNQRNPKNPDSSTVLQALQILAQLDNSFIEPAQWLAQNGELYKQADEILKGKVYNDTHVTWYKQFKVVENGIHTLSPEAIKLLMILSSIMSQGTNLVKASKQDLRYLSELSEHEYRNAIKELKENGCIAIFRKSKRHEPPVYMVNPDIAVCGKQKRHMKSEFNNLLDSKTKRERDAMKECGDMCALQIERETMTTEDGQVYMISVLREKKEKEPAPTTSADPQMYE